MSDDTPDLQLKVVSNAIIIDISHWYRWWMSRGGKCPNCGDAFSEMHPEQNLVPHFNGECKTGEPERKQ